MTPRTLHRLPNSIRLIVALLGMARGMTLGYKSFHIFKTLSVMHATEGDTALGREDCWFKLLIDIICGYTGLPEPLLFLLSCIYVPVCLKLCSDIIDQTLQSYDPRGRH